MSFLDTFTSELEKNVSESLSNIQKYTIDQALQSSQLVIQKAIGPRGNLTQQELNAGVRPAAPTVNANNTELNNSIQNQGQGSMMSKPYVKYGLYVAAGLAIAFFVFKKRG